MNTIKILLIEDEKDQQDIFKDTVDVLNSKKDFAVEYEIANNVQEAKYKLDGSYDGTIVDLKLGGDEEGGNEIVSLLGESFARIPVIFVTAFPDSVTDHPSVISTRSRDQGTYESDLQQFKEICDTGLTRIMGGRGVIEKNLSKVFLESLLPQKGKWISYGKEDSTRTERALLRHTLNHLSHLLEESEDSFFPEEAYLYPLLSDRITTGSIVSRNDQWFVILSPACDLVVRGNGKFKTDRILLVETEKEVDVVQIALADITRMSRKKRRLHEVFNNNFTDYYHWLPESGLFGGRFLNFRRLKNMDEDKFREEFEGPEIQISPSFVKDIVSRFSSFYARQGQPDIESKNAVERILVQSAST